ncbi:unnamed protein product [Rotaria magnacalcarata]|uniref:non-specific serine/threonine protein kinase n=4 Tax=Rotaria magnacalcarata TaxID=392030 RepID=A0A815H5C4_9BILA|nr:unnamed protein product [Rotaria magnacalcarata]CAF2151641.1 unnamed protein product [Rotaria magnacalcarata]
MSSNSKLSNRINKNKTLHQFDRGPIQVFNQVSTVNTEQIMRLQLLFFSLLEILSLKLTDNDPLKSYLLFEQLLNLLEQSEMLPISMCLSAKSIRHENIFLSYVRILQKAIQSTLINIQKDPVSSNRSVFSNVLPKHFGKILLSPPPPSPKISIDIPQQEIQLKIPLPLPINGTVAISGFGDAVIFRYVQDFYEIDKLGKGAFGSVFRAKNRLDDRMYAIKKIIFNKNTDRTRCQAQRALREVRVLAALSHPNIVQYHCAWLELVPFAARQRRTSSSPGTARTKIPIAQVKEYDSRDELIQFEGQSLSSQKSRKQDDEIKSSQKSSTTSTDSDEDGSEISIFGSNRQHSHVQIQHQYHSDGSDHTSFSSSKFKSEISKSYETTSNEEFSNKELVPLHTRNQSMLTLMQSNYIDSKIVLFIQMQLCDTTLHDWLRYRDDSIVQDTPAEKKSVFYTLNDLGQRQCWHIFKQLLTAVEYLHSQSFVHRDIKPRNIFLAYDSKDASCVHVKLGDFGLATLLDCDLTSHSSEHFKNEESTGVGTALYAPPEQLNSHRCITTAKSDSYSLGIVLFELFSIFSTEMERHRSLNDLRVNVKVEEQFSTSYRFESNIIEQLVSIESDNRPSVEDLLSIYGREMQQRMRKHNNTKQMIIEQLQAKLRDRDKRIQQLELELGKI